MQKMCQNDNREDGESEKDVNDVHIEEIGDELWIEPIGAQIRL